MVELNMYHMDIMVRVYAPKEKDTGSEILQLQMDTIPPTNIFRFYLGTGKPDEEKKSDRMQKPRSKRDPDGRSQCPAERHSGINLAGKKTEISVS